MIKPKSLRDTLEAALPDLKTSPDRLKVFIEQGNILATAAASDSFSVAYTLVLLLEDYAGEPALVFGIIISWLRTHQAELLMNPDLMKQGLTFDVDVRTNISVDLLIRLRLEERVIEDRGRCVFPPEPAAPDTLDTAGTTGPAPGREPGTGPGGRVFFHTGGAPHG